LNKKPPGHYAERLFEQLPVARFRCWNDNIDPKEKFLAPAGILSRYGPVAPPVVWSSEAGLMPVVAASNGLPGRREASIVGAANKRHRTVRYQRQVATRDR
jgi:hypothetical protein